MINGEPITVENCGVMSQLKGQVNAFDVILDVDVFFEDSFREETNEKI